MKSKPDTVVSEKERNHMIDWNSRIDSIKQRIREERSRRAENHPTSAPASKKSSKKVSRGAPQQQTIEEKVNAKLMRFR